MTDFERFCRNASSRGILIDTNLLVLLVVGAVNRERISSFKRTREYGPTDWDVLAGILEQVSRRYTIAHVLAEVSSLTDMKGPELPQARAVLKKTISLMQELSIPSASAADSVHYQRLGLTDAAIALAAQQCGCSVLTNDTTLYVALAAEGASVAKFDDVRVYE